MTGTAVCCACPASGHAAAPASAASATRRLTSCPSPLEGEGGEWCALREERSLRDARGSTDGESCGASRTPPLLAEARGASVTLPLNGGAGFYLAGRFTRLPRQRAAGSIAGS